MNQGKLEMVKQEMARVNIDILGISELKWTGRGEFNSDDHYIYYCGQESLRRNEVAIIVKRQKSPKCSTWMQSQKQQNDLCSFPRQTIQYHSISLLMISISLMILNINIIQYHHSISIQVYALTNNAEEAEVEPFCEDLKDLLERKR